jgi:hypothetical protein
MSLAKLQHKMIEGMVSFVGSNYGTVFVSTATKLIGRELRLVPCTVRVHCLYELVLPGRQPRYIRKSENLESSSSLNSSQFRTRQSVRPTPRVVFVQYWVLTQSTKC